MNPQFTSNILRDWVVDKHNFIKDVPISLMDIAVNSYRLVMVIVEGF